MCGPSDFPRDNAGIVLAVYDSKWYSNIGVVVMDDSTTKEIVGGYTKVGIDWYWLLAIVHLHHGGQGGQQVQDASVDLCQRDAVKQRLSTDLQRLA